MKPAKRLLEEFLAALRVMSVSLLVSSETLFLNRGLIA